MALPAHRRWRRRRQAAVDGGCGRSDGGRGNSGGRRSSRGCAGTGGWHMTVSLNVAGHILLVGYSLSPASIPAIGLWRTDAAAQGGDIRDAAWGDYCSSCRGAKPVAPCWATMAATTNSGWE